jgi:hypothetical protein
MCFYISMPHMEGKFALKYVLYDDYFLKFYGEFFGSNPGIWNKVIPPI